MKFAHEIKIERRAEAFEMTVDGEPFPWAVQEISTAIGVHKLPVVVISIPVDRLQIVNEYPTS